LLDTDPGARSAKHDEEEGEVISKKTIILGARCILDNEVEDKSEESLGYSIIGSLVTKDVEEDKEEVDDVAAEADNL
jgi:hypothetical protein